MDEPRTEGTGGGGYLFPAWWNREKKRGEEPGFHFVTEISFVSINAIKRHRSRIKV